VPHALTDRQRDYLNFIKDYIKENEISPRLEEIAEHFEVKSPTAHKMLKALQRKGFLIFDRTSSSGFFIRLIERVGAKEVVLRVPLAGKINHLGEVYDFPEPLGEIPAVFAGTEPGKVFALVLMEDIPQVNLEVNDFIFFDMGKKPQPGDICLGILGERHLLFRITYKTFDKEMVSYEASHDYPFPEELSDPEREQRLHYEPMAHTDELEPVFMKMLEDDGWGYFPVTQDFIVATALRLSRALSY